MKLIEIFDAEPERRFAILIFPERQFSPLMASKTNSETKQVISTGAASSPRKTRPSRTATPARSQRSVAAAETETSVPVPNISPSYVEPRRDEIARLAYLYWLERGCQNGSAEEDWFRAEQQLRQLSMG
jgi:hypothetical protein